MGYWNRKNELKKKANAHTNKMEELYSLEITECVNRSKIYDQTFVCKKDTSYAADVQQKIIVENMDSVQAVFHYGYDGATTMLNFASYKNPGGKFLEGSSAQEEMLCHNSFLYNVLSEFDKDYYEFNRLTKNFALYTNRALYTPDVLFLDGDEEVYSDVITCTAPNKYAAQKYCNKSEFDCNSVMRDRIHFVLDIAKEHNPYNLILGAWGCGVFGNDAEFVANSFKKELEEYYTDTFENIIFAIPGGINYTIFTKVFADSRYYKKGFNV